MAQSYIAAVIIGIALSGLWICTSRRFSHWESAIFGYSLVLGGAVYVLFGLLESRAIGSMVPECLVGIFFIVLAIAGLRGSLLALGVGWVLHGFWDVFSPHYLDVSYVPWFLEPTCVGFDFVVGIYLVLRSQGVIRNTERLEPA